MKSQHARAEQRVGISDEARQRRVAGWRSAACCGVVAGARNTRFLRLVERAIPRLAA
jgi:hypothetical protein